MAGKKIRTTHLAKLKRKADKTKKSIGSVNAANARSLEIFIENDRDLYHGQFLSICKNLVTKRARGEYAHDRAVDLFMYLADAGAKKFAKDEGSKIPWHKRFPMPDRREVARSMTDSFEAESDLGNYDYLLPIKYQRAGGTSGEKSAGQIKREVDSIVHGG
jgi:hypothetical protein